MIDSQCTSSAVGRRATSDPRFRPRGRGPGPPCTFVHPTQRTSRPRRRTVGGDGRDQNPGSDFLPLPPSLPLSLRSLSPSAPFLGAAVTPVPLSSPGQRERTVLPAAQVLKYEYCCQSKLHTFILVDYLTIDCGGGGGGDLHSLPPSPSSSDNRVFQIPKS